MSALETVNQMQYKNFVPAVAVDDYTLGRRIFQQAIAYKCCTSDAMRAGWNAAELQASLAEYEAGGWMAADALLAATL